jgi:hypothetical protein
MACRRGPGVCRRGPGAAAPGQEAAEAARALRFSALSGAATDQRHKTEFVYDARSSAKGEPSSQRGATVNKACILIAGLAALCVVSGTANARYIVSQNGPVITHMCSDGKPIVGCNWCSPTSGRCYVVLRCDGKRCTIGSLPTIEKQGLHPVRGTPVPYKLVILERSGEGHPGGKH